MLIRRKVSQVSPHLNSISRLLAIGFLYILALSGCAFLPSTVTPNPQLPFTQAAGTILARFTQEAASTTRAEPTSPTPVPTTLPPPSATASSPAEATATAIPLPPPVIIVTATPVPLPPPVIIVTATPLPFPSPTPVIPLSPCDWAQLVADVTIPDGSILMPDAQFVKIWRLRNIGTCTWDPGFSLLFVDGYRMGSPDRIMIPNFVYPGQTVDLAVPLTAPSQAGNYRGRWLLLNDQGVPFGIGAQAADPFSIAIKVIAANPDYAYDFTANVCQALWESATGNLVCPGDDGDPQGFVLLLDNPQLENESENQPALWTHPNYASNGWINGSYPAITIQDGYHFKTWLGCLNDSPGCNVQFILNYRVGGGPVENLGSWHEIYDGSITKVNLDLSDLVGQSITFLFRVEMRNNRSAPANAFWYLPRLVQQNP
jgi:hypothetical protein